MTTEEGHTVEQLARSGSAPTRIVDRARIILLSREGLLVPAIARELDIDQKTVRLWLKRFNERGIVGLENEPRPGRPPTYTAEEVGELIGVCLTNPRDLELPFASWTLDRLEAYLNEAKGITIKRARINEILLAKGVRWLRRESRFSEDVAPVRRRRATMDGAQGPGMPR